MFSSFVVSCSSRDTPRSHLLRIGTVKALDDLSLEVPAGIVFGFLGPNGAGKTTTIHLLLGLLLGLVVANLSKGQGSWQFYTHVDLLLEALALSLLASLLGVSGGVLISLHSATVRQAQQLLIVATAVLVGGGVLALKAVPAQVISSLSASQSWLIVMAVLAILDAILLGVSLLSFRRSRLILS